MTIIEDKIRELEKIPFLGIRPQDFEDFWRKNLQKEKSVPPGLELKKIPYPLSKVEVFKATLLARDQVKLQGYYLRPKNARNLPGLVRFHGYSSNRGQISELLLWALQGYAILALDVRGQCGETGDARAYPQGAFSGWMTLGIQSPQTYYFRQVYLDALRAVEALANQKEVDEKRIGCMGKSQGGALALVATALNNTFGPEFNLKAQVKAITAAIPFLADFRQGYRMQREGPLDELAWYFRLHDPAHEKEEKIFATLDYFDIVHFAPWLGKETAALVSMSLKDTVCPPPTIYSLYKALPGRKKILVYPEYEHEVPDVYVDEQIAFLAKELGLELEL